MLIQFGLLYRTKDNSLTFIKHDVRIGAGYLLFLCGVIRQNLVQGLVLSLKALVSVLAVPDVEEPQVVSPLAYG